MNKGDAKKLFALLDKLYGRKQMDAVQEAVWETVLRPWPYEAVREAVIRRARENEYRPNPGEVAKYLPQEEARIEVPVSPAHVRWVRAYHDRLREELHRLGLPEFRGATGREYQEWRAMCAEAGLDPGAVLEETKGAMA